MKVRPKDNKCLAEVYTASNPQALFLYHVKKIQVNENSGACFVPFKKENYIYKML
jgi:hypothetical protein